MSKLFRILNVQIRIQKDFDDLIYSVRLGNTTKGFFTLTKSLRELTIAELKNLLKELEDSVIAK